MRPYENVGGKADAQACADAEPRADGGGSRAPAADPDAPFWRRKTLEEMTEAEWESLCDGCGRCCLNKLEDWDTGEIAWTNVACRLLDCTTGRCGDYAGRRRIVPDCVALDAATVRSIAWLPPNCGYRLIAEGRDLYWWHPLVSGDPDTVRAAGVSVAGRAISEEGLEPEDLEDHVVDWPGEMPARARRRSATPGAGEDDAPSQKDDDPEIGK